MHSVPFGRRLFTSACQSWSALTVESRKSNDPAIFFNSAVSRVFTKWSAPISSASASLSFEVESAVTSAPNAFANCNPRCPSPPIPTTPTRDDGRTPWFRSGEYTVIPPHSSGATFSLSSPSGTGIANREFTRTASAYPPFRPTQVGCDMRAQVLVALPAPLADPAAIRLPADPNALANLAVLHIRAHRRHRPHNLVPGDERVLAVPPVVVDQVDIRVAYPAVRNLYLYLICLQLARVIPVRHQLRTGGMHCQSMDLNCSHRSLHLFHSCQNPSRT